MRRKLRLLASAATLLISVLALGLFAYRIAALRTQGSRSAEAEYSILRNALVDVRDKTQLADEILRGRLLALFQGSDRLLAAQVLDDAGLALWKVPAKSRYFALPNDKSARSGFSAPGWSTIVLDTALPGGMRLRALYTSFKSADLSRAALPSFVMTAVWFAALMVFLFFLRKDPEELDRGIDVPKGEAGDEKPEIRIVPLAEGEGKAEIEESPGSGGAGDWREAGKEAEPAEEVQGTEEASAQERVAWTEETGQEPATEEQAGPPLSSSWLKPSEAEAGPSDRKFEETLARLEEEVKEWSTKHAAAQAAAAAPEGPAEEPPGPPAVETSPPSPAEPSVAPPEAPVDEDIADEELEEELEELEAEEESPPPQVEPARAEPAPSPAAPAPKEAPAAAAPAPPETPPAPPREERKRLVDLPLPLSLQDQALEARLSAELSKSRADLALILVHCGLASESDPAAVALFATLRDYVGTRDLIFELYKGAFAAVLPSVDLGAALKMSEDLADVLGTTYGLYRDLDGEAPVYIGISARSGRPVDAFKLYREASTALHKAFSGGPSKILAFRPRAD